VYSLNCPHERRETQLSDWREKLKNQDIQPLLDAEIEAVVGGNDIPPPDGIWDWIPGMQWPPLMDPGANTPPGQP